jgi:multidrug resistance protein, MATE family
MKAHSAPHLNVRGTSNSFFTPIFIRKSMKTNEYPAGRMPQHELKLIKQSQSRAQTLTLSPVLSAPTSNKKNFKISQYKQEISQLFQLGLPIIISQLGTVAMGMADIIQLGQISGKSADAVAAAGISNVLLFTIAVVGVLALGVVAPMISKAVAAEKFDEVGNLYKAGLRVAWYLAPATALIGFGLGFCLPFLNQDPNVVLLAQPFNHLVAFSMIPMFLFNAFRQLTDGLGNTRVGMTVTLTGLGLNILLNTLLIPHLELVGAGIATLISRVYMAVAMWVIIRQNDDFKRFTNYSKSNIKPFVRQIFQTGLPSGLQGFLEVAVFGAAILLIGWYGKYQQAAHQIALNICNVSYMIVTGVAAAGGIRVGHFWGLKNRAAMHCSGTTAFALATGVMACSSLLFHLIPTQLVHLYTTDAHVVSVTVELLFIGSLFQLSDGIQATALGVLRGLSDVHHPTLFSLLAYWVVGLPLGWFLADAFGMESKGIWIGLTVSLTMLAFLLGQRFYAKLKEMPL